MSNIGWVSELPGIVKADLGMPTVSRPITDTLYVSPNGDNTDGSTWERAFNTIQAALDAASTDADDCTAILISPHATYYNIDTTGDPTWTGNYHITCTHRIWAAIRNEHASATSVMKFTGKVSIDNLAIFTEDAVDGVIFTNSGWRVRRCGFNSTGTTGANTSLNIDGSGGITRGGILEDVEFLGNQTYTTAIYINKSTANHFEYVNIHDCLKGIQIVDADSDKNYFCNVDIGISTIGIDIDAGNTQHFRNVNFHGCTTNIDDEVGDHIYSNLTDNFDITIDPDTFAGVQIDTAVGADTWGTDTEIRAAATSTRPFRIVDIIIEGSAAELFRVRFSDDSGSTFFTDLMVKGAVNEVQSIPSQAAPNTEHIFNAGTRISASAKSEGGGEEAFVWLKIQEV